MPMPTINRWGKHHIMTFTERLRGRFIRIKARGTRPPWTCSDAGPAILGARGSPDHVCRKVAPPSFELSPPDSPVLNMDAFLSAQLANGEYCSARMLETTRTLDGLEQQVQALRYEHALSERKQDDGRATLEAAKARRGTGEDASLDA